MLVKEPTFFVVHQVDFAGDGFAIGAIFTKEEDADAYATEVCEDPAQTTYIEQVPMSAIKRMLLKEHLSVFKCVLEKISG